MTSNKNPALLQKIILISLIALGAVFIVTAVLPEIFEAGEKGFGYTQIFLIRNGLFVFLVGLTLLLFPKIVDYIKNAFNDKVYQSERSKHLTSQPLLSKYDFIALLLFLVAANYFVIYFIGREHTVYTWDASHFWSKFIEITKKFKASPIGATKFMLASTQHGEYNYFAPFLLVPFSLIFGIERLPYILSITNIFGFLSAFSFILLFKRFSGIKYGDNAPVSSSMIALFTFLTFPFIWMPTLFGYLAIGGFFMMCTILFIYFKFPLSSQKYKNLIIIGILLSVMVIFRRWYSFWAVSFMASLIINELIFLYIDHKFDKERLIVLAKKTSVVILTAGTFYLIFAGPRLLEVVTKDYTYLAIAFNLYDSVLGDFKVFLNRFGPFYVSLAALGLLIAFYDKNTRKIASFLLIQWIITFALFTRMASFVYHHYYLLLPTLLLLISLTITELLKKTKSIAFKTLSCSVYILVSAFIFISVFTPEVSSYSNQVKGFLPAWRYYPLVRSDVDEIKRIMNVLGNHIADSNDLVYVLAGSETLNSDALMRAEYSLEGTPNIGKNVFRTHDLDLRDGFPLKLFKAKYIVVAEPIQCDLGCNKQRVISIAAESILKGDNLGKSYEQLPYEFSLERGVKTYIYKRDDSPVQADIKFLSEALRKHYPDNPNVYESSE